MQKGYLLNHYEGAKHRSNARLFVSADLPFSTQREIVSQYASTVKKIALGDLEPSDLTSGDNHEDANVAAFDEMSGPEQLAVVQGLDFIGRTQQLGHNMPRAKTVSKGANSKMELVAGA